MGRRKIVYQECQLNPMRIEYVQFRQAEGGTDLDGEWHFSHYSHHKTFEIVTQAGEVLFRIAVSPSCRDKKQSLENYYAALSKARIWLYRCRLLAYTDEVVLGCRHLGEKVEIRNRCILMNITPDGNVGCSIRPFSTGYASNSSEVRPFPPGMVCDLKNIAYMLQMNKDVFQFSLNDYWLCKTGEMKIKIERPVKTKGSEMLSTEYPLYLQNVDGF